VVSVEAVDEGTVQTRQPPHRCPQCKDKVENLLAKALLIAGAALITEAASKGKVEDSITERENRLYMIRYLTMERGNVRTATIARF
jgi:hypothetical protein